MSIFRGHKAFIPLRAATGDQRGNTLVFVAAAAAAIFAFAALAIDGAMLMVTRTQLHNAADAAALAGATALINLDREEAVARAIAYASYNEAFRDGAEPVDIEPDDITFPADDEIRVRTHRTSATNDALRTLFLRVVDPKAVSADMSAAATARVYDVCASRCLKPWAIPDRWDDTNHNGIWDPGEYYHPEYTGYRVPDDVGARVVLKVGRPADTTVSGNYYVVNFPPLESDEKPLTGAEWYRQWIAGCSPWVVRVGDHLQTEPGRMVGPTRQGIVDLIAQDPGAYWDAASKTVKGSAFPRSPRVGLIPFFDPTLPFSGRGAVTVTKLGAFFIEGVDANSEVTGRFIQITEQGSPCAGGNGSSFVKNIVLVE